MPIVTITTDFGLGDYYVAVIKGALLRQCDQLQIVDITHQIRNYDIVQGAFIFRHAWTSFPPGSIHLLSINDFYSPQKRFVVIPWQEHYFIGPDNGLFSLIFESMPAEAYELPFPEEESFPIKTIFARTVAHIEQQHPLADIGPPAGQLMQRITLQPVISPSFIRGAVIHIDNYENAVLNISSELFHRVGKNRAFSLYFKRHDPITQLSRHYFDVPVGEPLCLFNSSGLLEIAINLGRAGSLLGLKVEDTVQVDFFD